MNMQPMDMHLLNAKEMNRLVEPKHEISHLMITVRDMQPIEKIMILKSYTQINQ